VGPAAARNGIRWAGAGASRRSALSMPPRGRGDAGRVGGKARRRQEREAVALALVEEAVAHLAALVPAPAARALTSLVFAHNFNVLPTKWRMSKLHDSARL